jgi:hypothetical protein
MGDVSVSSTDIRILNEFKLQLSLGEVAKYQKLIQLALFYNQKIMGLKVQEYAPESAEKPSPTKSKLQSRKSLLVRAPSNSKVQLDDLKRAQT